MLVREKKNIEKRENKKEISCKKIFFFLLASFFFPLVTQAQCAMCRAVLESEEGGTQAEAVNDGIVYLMAFPYILIAIIGYVIYRMKVKNKQSQ